MEKSKWNIKFGALLIGLSAILYAIHYLIFRDAHHMFLFMVEDIAFIPIEVLFVSLILHKILEEREKKHMLEKLNMLIGVFFSEIGTRTLDIISSADPKVDELIMELKGIINWSDQDFLAEGKRIREHRFVLDMDKMDVLKTAGFLKSKRDFLIGMLQNPVLLEHETFTELLRATFHLEDELSYRISVCDLKEEDYDHFKMDMERVYPLLAYEWITYMQYLKKNYPYLFAVATKQNPFER